MTATYVSETDRQLQLIREWLMGRERNDALRDIDMDLDLIDAGVLSSLDFLNFVCLLEELTNRELRIDENTAHAFRTLRSIRDNILAS